MPPTRHRDGLSPKSLQRHLSAIRAWFRFLLREGAVAANPAEGVRAPKVRRTLPHTLDADQVSHLMDLPGNAPLDLRDRAIMELFYSSGLRLAELVSLDVSDTQSSDGLLQVTGKGNKMRRLPVGRFASEALEKWLAVRAATREAGRTRAVRQPAWRAPEPACRRGPVAPARHRAGHAAPRASAHAAPFLRQPHPRVVRRPAGRAGTARARRYQHHPDLHPPGFSAPRRGLRQGPPAGKAPPLRHMTSLRIHCKSA